MSKVSRATSARRRFFCSYVLLWFRKGKEGGVFRLVPRLLAPIFHGPVLRRTREKEAPRRNNSFLPFLPLNRHCSESHPCPTDVPEGTTAKPSCALSTAGSASPTFCGLICVPDSPSSKCPKGASCKKIEGSGLCTYDE